MAIKCDTSDRRKEDSSQNDKRCCNVRNDITHVTISDLRCANNIVLVIITIHRVFCNSKIHIINYHTAMPVVCYTESLSKSKI